jgi:hypothetical protein
MNFVSKEFLKILVEANTNLFPFPVLEEALKKLDSQINRTPFYEKYFVISPQKEKHIAENIST